jgi:tetratricopeptide (TPR) repeat protein
MIRGRLQFFRLIFVPGLSLILIGTAVNGQQKRTREELLREAGRLVTEAERRNGDAIHKARAGADRKLIREAEKSAAEAFEKAIELWREADHDERLVAGVDELTRLYSVLGEYEKVVDRLTREAEYWRNRGNVAEQVDTLYTLGIRQSQMGREAAAIETLERVVEMSRSAGLRSLEPNVLTNLAISYERVGRAKDAAAANEKAKKLWSVRHPAVAVAEVRKPVARITIPVQWVDLPGAPAAAEYRDIRGVSQAVLVNRSDKGIEMVMFGCVALEDQKKVRLLYRLGGEGRNHGGVRPGDYFTPFTRLNGPMNRWTDEGMGCEGAGKMTVIEVTFDDRTTWKAEGLDWTP